jgi:hypothetical protein
LTIKQLVEHFIGLRALASVEDQEGLPVHRQGARLLRFNVDEVNACLDERCRR